MKVCDMCLKRIGAIDEKKVTFDDGTIIEQRYSLCPKCRDKLKKYIKFEASRKGGGDK